VVAKNLAIHEAIHARRTALGQSQTTVARKAGTPQSNLSAIELGKVDPRLSSVQDIARALGMELVLVPTEVLPTVRALIGQGNSPDDRPLFVAEPD
jgi:predicted transcriptional regulator